MSTRLGLLRWHLGRLFGRQTVRARRLGFDFDLDLRDNVQQCLFRFGTYDPKLLSVLTGELRAGDVYADIGAHIGIHALVCARRLTELGGGRVIAFEPAVDSSARLLAAAARAGLRNVTLVQTGLGSAPGSLTLFADPDYDFWDASVRSAYGPGRDVGTFSVTTFDDWAARTGLDRLDVVKIDVEGAEHDVVLGMRRSLKQFRPRLLVLETKGYLLERAGVSRADLTGLLEGLGYEQTPGPGMDDTTFRLVA